MNLLPQEEKDILKKGFRIRVFVLANIFFSVFFISASILLLPSYFLAREQISLISTIDSSVKPEDEDSINKTLLIPTELRSKIGFLENNLKNKKAFDFLTKVVSLKGEGVKINSIFFNKTPEGDQAKVSMLVSGNANTRDSLINFQSSLKEAGIFESVDIPVSSFAKDKNLPFSINLIISREKNEKLDS